MLPLLPESYFEKFDPIILLALRQTDKMTHGLATQTLFNQRTALAVTYQKNFLYGAINSRNFEIDTNLILTGIKNPNFSMTDRWCGMFIIAAKNKLVLSSNIKAIEIQIKDQALLDILKNRGRLKNFKESFFGLTEEEQINHRFTQDQISIVFNMALNKLNAGSRDERCLSLQILTTIASRLTEKQIIELSFTKLDDWDSDNIKELEDLFSYVIVLGKWNCVELDKINVEHSPNRILIQYFAALFHQITSPNSNKQKSFSPKLDIGFFASQTAQKKITPENNDLASPALSLERNRQSFI